MKFLGKLMELENIIQSEVTKSQKNIHGMHSLISGYYSRSSEYSRPLCMFTIQRLHEALSQSMDTLVLLRRGIKIPMGRDTEKKMCSRYWRKGHLQIAQPGDPSHIQ